MAVIDPNRPRRYRAHPYSPTAVSRQSRAVSAPGPTAWCIAFNLDLEEEELGTWYQTEVRHIGGSRNSTADDLAVSFAEEIEPDGNRDMYWRTDREMTDEERSVLQSRLTEIADELSFNRSQAISVYDINSTKTLVQFPGIDEPADMISGFKIDISIGP